MFSPCICTKTIKNDDRFHWKRWPMKTVSKLERFENDIVIMISLSCRRIGLTENANFWKRCKNSHKLFKLSWHANNRFPLVFTVFNRFQRFRVDGWKRYENGTKTMCRCNTIVAFSLKTISFSMKTYSCRWGFSWRYFGCQYYVTIVFSLP